ncbi:MAG: hypothetical protein A3B38_04160 [Candidatus Levybacteria bacterium RIFCSPLOWO2_01_FULL_36_13]|nr:MAG: hypothetical protein A2684_01085 [Candidatus Levybacteria bacterium RIFCSPHIGHO2_01_FULL_36_15b]OGH34320.1 MAG: hypothetical protein A3B38_04160 [Candidatus Levybacteria bacterium RIFCSPLOWO2_01_FULL_36_13]
MKEKQQESRSLSKSVQGYLTDSERTVLRPHQLTVFEDIRKFFEEGNKRGYVSLPTGTGKTVLFVELSKALLDVQPEQKKPKILVVTPSKDLVHQTMGKSGERGYGKFAPELGVGSYFSDTPSSEKTEAGFLDNDVVITTYDSFAILTNATEYEYTPIEHVKIPRVKIPRVKIEHIEIPEEDLKNHGKGQFSDGVINSEIYKRMVEVFGEEGTIKAVSKWKEYPVLNQELFETEYYKRILALYGEKEALKRIKIWQSYPKGDDFLNSTIFKKIEALYGEKEALKIIKQWQSYPIVDEKLFESKFYKKTVEFIGVEKARKTISSLEKYPLSAKKLFESDFYKRIVSLFGKKGALEMIRQWQSLVNIEQVIFEPEFHKKTISFIAEKEALNKLRFWRSYPIINDLLESDTYKKWLIFYGEKDLMKSVRTKKSFPVITDRKLIDNFDIFVLDEAHHVFGQAIADLVQSIPEDKLVIGFTATPEANRFKKLQKYLPYEIHNLGITEAISLDLLAPMLPVALKSGLRIDGSDIYDERGEYIDTKISYLAHDEKRNKIVVEATKAMSSLGKGIIISCIAGGEAWHAKYLAEKLKEEGIKAEAIYSEVPAKTRQEIYDKFNRGEINALTFIGVIGEGWDSERAKVIINARPTRSDIFAKQRLGRITRRNGELAVAIDIQDDFDPKNPPVTVADALEVGKVSFGTIIGTNTDVKEGEILSLLKNNTPIEEQVKAPFSEFKNQLATLPQLKRGFVLSERGFPEYAIATRVNGQYRGLTTEFLDKVGEVNNIEINKRTAAMDRSTREVYSIDQTRRLLASLPRVEPSKYYIDSKNNKWISIKGLQALFSRRFTNLSEGRLVKITTDIQDELSWIPAVYEINNRGSRLFFAIKLFSATPEAIRKITEAIEKSYNN